jgi:hypothetical protein
VSPYVDNIMIHADPFHSYCVALIVASHHALENWASKQGISYGDISELCKRPEAIKEVQSSLVKVCTPFILQSICLASVLLFMFFLVIHLWPVVLDYMGDCPQIRGLFLIGKGHQVHSPLA